MRVEAFALKDKSLARILDSILGGIAPSIGLCE